MEHCFRMRVRREKTSFLSVRQNNLFLMKNDSEHFYLYSSNCYQRSPEIYKDYMNIFKFAHFFRNLQRK